MKRVGILISGRGSNMVSLLDAMDRGDIQARCAVVVSNVYGAPGLSVAEERGVPTFVVDHRQSSTRKDHDNKVLRILVEHGVQIVCLAGYMRILSPMFVKAFEGRLLNIHPSLLPSFPGLHVQQKAIDHGARFSGCTVHFVDDQVDHGCIFLQAVVPILPGDDEVALSKRILDYEHRIYPTALKLLCEEKAILRDGKVHLSLDDEEYRHLLADFICPAEDP